jgi:hypothetical protein
VIDAQRPAQSQSEITLAISKPAAIRKTVGRDAKWGGLAERIAMDLDQPTELDSFRYCGKMLPCGARIGNHSDIYDGCALGPSRFAAVCLAVDRGEFTSDRVEALMRLEFMHHRNEADIWGLRPMTISESA